MKAPECFQQGENRNINFSFHNCTQLLWTEKPTKSNVTLWFHWIQSESTHWKMTQWKVWTKLINVSIKIWWNNPKNLNKNVVQTNLLWSCLAVCCDKTCFQWFICCLRLTYFLATSSDRTRWTLTLQGGRNALVNLGGRTPLLLGRHSDSSRWNTYYNKSHYKHRLV